MSLLGRPSSYQCPRHGTRPDLLHGWLLEANQEAENFLQSQRAWGEIDGSIEIISGGGMPKVSSKQSRVHINMLKRDIRETVATLANIRPIASFKTDNSLLMGTGVILNKLFRAWYMNTRAYKGIRTALQHAAGTGVGYVSPVWEKDFWVAGRGDVALKTYGARDVLPVQIGKDHDLQKAYAVTLRDEMPLNQAWAKFPTYTDLLHPDRGSPTWLRKGLQKVQRFLSPALNAFGQGRGRERDNSPFPTVDIFRTYVLDLSYNDTGSPILMGDGRWRYTVPVYGSDIETGEFRNGEPVRRKATLEDSMMYPMRRLIIWTNQGVIYDDSSTFWHGRVPVIPFRLDDWPWEFIGCPMTRDGRSIQESATRLLRAIDDSANARLDSPLAFDENMISRGLMERLNPRIGGQRIPINMTMGDGVKPLIPAQYYDVPTWIPDFVKGLYENLHYLLGTRDIQAIAKAKQIPAGDSLEKLMELAGPIITDMSKNMEDSVHEIGEQMKSNFFEFYDMQRRVQVLGQDGVTEEDFDFKPGTMIPSHTPDELERIKRGELQKDYTSKFSEAERARKHQNSFFFHIAPNSMHQITQLTKKLLLMQLFRAGFPIDPWTVAEGFDIENYGDPDQIKAILGTDKVPSDVFGRWLAWMEVKQKLGQREGGHPGRKPSGQQAPTTQSKDGGSRTTVRESPR
jgi:hypothetical protein